MEIEKLFSLLHTAEALKDNTRHSWTSKGRRESVAEHCFRLSVMAYFVKDEYPGLDWNRLILMCLFHDMGEAFTGDIPAFIKTKEDEKREEKAIDGYLSDLPEPYRKELSELFSEMEARKTTEAKLCWGLDKMETLIQHNEAPIETWLPLEYEKNFTYGEKETAFSEYLIRLRKEINRVTSEKIQNEKK